MMNRMMTRGTRAALLAVAVSLPGAATARSDEQLWLTGSVNVKLADKWRLSEEVVTRFSDNRNGLYEVESNTLLGYRVSKTVTVWAGYTHDPQYSRGDFTVMEHRAREQVTADNVAQFGRAKLSLRMRLEQRWREGVEGTGWRLRPYLKYSLPLKGKTALNVSTEPFLNLNTTAFQQQSGLDRVRNLITISTPLSKHLNIEGGYMNQYAFVRDGEDSSDNIAYFALSANF